LGAFLRPEELNFKAESGGEGNEYRPHQLGGLRSTVSSIRGRAPAPTVNAFLGTLAAEKMRLVAVNVA